MTATAPLPAQRDDARAAFPLVAPESDPAPRPSPPAPPCELASEPFRIGPWTINPRHNQMARGELVRELSPKAMEVLMVLARSPGQAVSRVDLIEVVWQGNHFVGEKRLNDEIWRLRAAFGDDNRVPEFIKTLPRVGYTLLAPVIAAEPLPGDLDWPNQAVVGHYTVGAPIGGVLGDDWYAALDRRDGRAVQLRLTRDADRRRVLLRTAQRLALAPRFGVTQPIDYGEDRDVAYLAMPVADGDAIEPWVRQVADARRLGRLLTRLAHAVERLGGQGLALGSVNRTWVASGEAEFDVRDLDATGESHGADALKAMQHNLSMLKAGLPALLERAPPLRLDGRFRRRLLAEVASAGSWESLHDALDRLRLRRTPGARWARLATAGFIATLLLASALLWRENARQLELRRSEADLARGVEQFVIGLLDVGAATHGADTRAAIERMLEAGTRMLPSYSGLPRLQLRLCQALGTTQLEHGRFDAAESLARQARSIATVIGDRTGRLDAELLLGLVQRRASRPAEAERTYRALLDELQGSSFDPMRSAQLASAHDGLGVALGMQGLLSDAEPELRQGLALRRSLLGEQHLDVARSIGNLGILFHLQGRYADAEAHFAEGTEMLRRLYGPDHPHLGRWLINNGDFLTRTGRYAEADTALVDGLRIIRATYGDRHYMAATALGTRAQLKLRTREFDTSQRLLDEAAALLSPDQASDRGTLAELGELRADLVEARGDPVAAAPLHRAAIEQMKQALGEQHPVTLRAIRSQCLRLQAGRGAEASAAAAPTSCPPLP